MSPTFNTGVSIPGYMFGANLVIPDQNCDELLGKQG